MTGLWLGTVIFGEGIPAISSCSKDILVFQFGGLWFSGRVCHSAGEWRNKPYEQMNDEDVRGAYQHCATFVIDTGVNYGNSAFRR